MLKFMNLKYCHSEKIPIRKSLIQVPARVRRAHRIKKLGTLFKYKPKELLDGGSKKCEWIGMIFLKFLIVNSPSNKGIIHRVCH